MCPKYQRLLLLYTDRSGKSNFFFFFFFFHPPADGEKVFSRRQINEDLLEDG